MSNEIKFEQKYDYGYMGAEGWGENAPFIAYMEKYVIIVDKNGIEVATQDMSCGWYKSADYSHFSAKMVALGLEKLGLKDFINFVKTGEEFQMY